MIKSKKAEESIKRKKTKYKKNKSALLRLSLLVIILALVNIYIILGLIYKGDGFTITLDSENGKWSNLVIYDDPADKTQKTYLKAEKIRSFSDISIDWLPKNINDRANGSHNGSNYIAYTFYVENMGHETADYWSTVKIDRVIQNVDEAVRVMVYKNGQRTVYAKASRSGEPERGTVPFYSPEDNIVMQEEVRSLQVGEIDKYTIVIWIEGDDPECIDSLIGGEIELYMTLTEEHISHDE